MLDVAERRVAEAGLSDRFQIRLGRVPDVDLEPASFDLLISNTFLHHVPEPREFWAWAKRLVRPGGGFFVRDLRRPESSAQVDALVERYAGDAEPIHREDYRNSYFAALTPAEVAADVRATGLDMLEAGPLLDRYWLVHGRR
jgi:2-polyprenyl-3-methyl-5-hydroxy-6-metoxy-1,4-benzoquinol methylase